MWRGEIEQGTPHTCIPTCIQHSHATKKTVNKLLSFLPIFFIILSKVTKLSSISIAKNLEIYTIFNFNFPI